MVKDKTYYDSINAIVNQYVNQNHQEAGCIPLEEMSSIDISEPFVSAISVISGRWKLPILLEIYLGNGTRFNALKRNLDGIPVSMLSSSLRELKDDGLIYRIQYNEIPLRVEYYLTDKGLALFKVLIDLINWKNDVYE